MTREEIKKQWELEFGSEYEDYQRANVYTAVDILDFAESVVNKLLISGVVSTYCDCKVKGSFDTETIHRCRKCDKEMV